MITLFPSNILETGTVTVTGTPDTGYPEERLWDRSGALFWRKAGAGALEFHVDQGSSVGDVDLLWVTGHNFDGEDLTWQYSDNDADWSDAVTGWTQSGNGAIAKALDAAASHRYWRLTVTAMNDPMCGEIWMGAGSEFAVMGTPRPQEADRSNIVRQEGVGGMVSRVKLGPTRQVWDYNVRLRTAAEITSLRSALAALDGIFKPLVVKDMDGSYWLMELMSDPGIDREEPNRGYATLALLEAL